MDVVFCSGHQKPCFLKTGTKEGPNRGKSFYICSVPESRCQFVKPADLKPLNCPEHPDIMAELQAIHESPTTHEKRHLLRCRAREKSQKWCTYRVIENKEPDPKMKEDLLSFKALSDSCKKPSENPRQATAGETKKQTFSGWRESPINKAQQKDVCNEPADLVKKNLFKQFQKESGESEKKKDDLPLSQRISETSKKVSTSSEEAKLDKGDGEDANDSFSQWRDSPAAKQKISSSFPPKSLKKDLQRQLEKQKKLLSCTKISQLPDNGARLLGNIKDLEKYLAELELAESSPQNEEKDPNDSDIQIVASNFPKEKPKDDDDNDSDVEVVAFYPPKPKPKEPQVVKVYPPAASGQKPVHMPTSQQANKPPVIRVITSRYPEQQPINKPTAQANKPQVIRVFPSGHPGQQPTYKPIAQAKEPQIIRVFPSGHSGQQPIHNPTTEVAEPPKSVQDWIDRNYTTYKPYQSHNPENLAQTKLWCDDSNIPKDLQDRMTAYQQQGTYYGGRMTVKRLQIVREAMKTVIDSLHKQQETCPKESDTLPDPEGLKVSLMVHQSQALAWLTWRENQIPSGGILADDMGLGKTLTMISLILTQKQRSEDEDGAGENSKWFGKSKRAIKSSATLIITPASLIHQWDKEIKNRCKNRMLRVCIYHGPNREKDVALLSSNDVVLTTYRIISSEIGRKEDSKCADLPPGELDKKEDEQEEDVSDLPLLLKINWNRIILDEAHDIRNHKSLSATAICRLRANTRWAVTGTPIQNKLLDMFSLIRYLRFSPFDEYKVWKKQVESNESLGKVRLNSIIKSLMLRRTKTQTFEGKPLVNLTKKELTWTRLTLSKAERNLYNKIFKKTQTVVKNYIQRHEEKEMTGGVSSSSSTSSYVPSQAEGGNPFQAGSSQRSQPGQQTGNNSAHSGKDILMLLLRLRQCCNHPSLLKEAEFVEAGLDLDLEGQMKDLLLKDDTEPNEGDSALKEDIFDRSAESTKIAALLKEVTNIRETEKAKCVVVSEWTKMLSLVSIHLKRMGLRYHLLQGDVPPQKRMEMVEDFNNNSNGPEVMLLSLKAGGVGLNLIGGSHLFLMDSHWNPALEEQTSDRIHRVGQKKDVKIHRFICEETIEEKIIALQDKKRTLAKDVLSGDGAAASRLGLNDLRMLFDV